MDKSVFDNFISRMDGNGEFLTRFLAAVRGGENSILHNRLSQAVTLDESWITTIEGALYSIEQIVRNPRKFISESELIVDVAKARRTNSRTVRHLSSHSQFIQSIDDNGEVRPKKLLTAELEEELGIYENRFICALVNRLIIFVEQRYVDLNNKLDVFTQTNVRMHSAFSMGENRFRCEINLSVDEPPEDVNYVNMNRTLFERIEVLRRRLRVLQSTEFMRQLGKGKPVRPPIQKTNLLTKNIDYNNCYKLWLYISSYTYLGYSVEVQDKNLPVGGDYYDDLSVIAALSLGSLVGDNVLNRDKYAELQYSEPQEREYTIVNNFEFTPDFGDSKQQVGADAINEYYYRRMRDELYRAAEDGEFEIENSLNVNFVKFFRSVSRINDAMFTELIDDQIERTTDFTVITPLDKKKLKKKRLKERLKRTKLYLKLKWEELERAQRLVERTQSRLDRLNEDIVAAEDKRNGCKSSKKLSKKKEKQS